MIRSALLLLLLFYILEQKAGAEEAETARFFMPLSAEMGGTLPVDIFHPAFCNKPGEKPHGVLVLFAGMARNSATYRDRAIPLARSVCALVFVPYFSKKRFPNRDYQRGGGGLTMIPPLVKWVRQQENLPVILAGHSAGAQFLSCVAAYAPPRNSFFILASPSTYVEPSLSFTPPYGFSGLREGALRHYLAQHLILLVGANDTGSNHLLQTRKAEEEGANRLERARYFWQKAQNQARIEDINLTWQFHIIKGLGHNATDMLNSPDFSEAVQYGFSVLSSNPDASLH